MDIEFWDKNTVMRFFGGMTTSTLYRQIAAGVIPKPARISKNISRWVKEECLAAARAIADRPRELKKVDLVPKDDLPRKKRGRKPKVKPTTTEETPRPQLRRRPMP